MIVGIAGGTASGKSTLAAALRGALLVLCPERRTELIATDSFWRDRTGPPRFVSASTGEERFDHNHPDALDVESLLVALERIEADVVLVEGLMVLHIASVRERCDLRLFVELDADERALRRMLRDMRGGRTVSEPEAIATYYRESARIGHERYVEPSRMYADLIVRGDGDFGRTAGILAGVVGGCDHRSALSFGGPHPPTPSPGAAGEGEPDVSVPAADSVGNGEDHHG
jgi:uridine kinase